MIGSQLLSIDVDAQQANGLILDASEGGMAIQLVKPLKSRSRRTLSFHPPGQTSRIQLKADPVWTNGDRVGVRFAELDRNSHSALQDWLASLPPERSPAPAPTPDEIVFADIAEPHPDSHPHEPPLEVLAAAPAAPAFRAPATPNPSATPSQESLDSMASRARILLCGTGAAVAWGSPKGMMCRASDGDAPPKGVSVDMNRGLSGECVLRGAVVLCEDTEIDPRVDPEVCRQLRLRSAIIVPITGAAGLLGLLEVFSDKPRAFSERDIPTLRTLAGQFEAPAQPPRTPHLEKHPPRPTPPATRPAPPVQVPSATAAPPRPKSPTRPPIQRRPQAPPRTFQVEKLRRTLSNSAEPDNPKWNRKLIFAALIVAASILAGSIYLAANKLTSGLKAPNSTSVKQSSDSGIELPHNSKEPASRRTSARRTTRRSPAAKPSPTSGASNTNSVVSPATEGADQQPAATTLTPPKSSDQEAPPTLARTSLPRELTVLNEPPSTAVPSLGSDMNDSRVSELKVLRQVAPEYPKSALLERRQGAVMLRLNVGSNGRVKDARVLSGDEDLARAALDAVREWRYQPYTVNGRPVEVTTDTIVTFSLNATTNH